MADLIRAGKVRYFGVSNYRSWRLAEICNLCDKAGIDRPIVSQPYYNAMNRMPEVEHLPACGYYGLGDRALQPARARRADRQVRSGRSAGRGHPGRPPGHAHDADRVAPRIAGDRPGDQAPRRGQGDHAGPVRVRLGPQQPAGDRGDRRAAHARAVRGLSAGARLSLRRRGRGPGRRLGHDRPSLDARASTTRPIRSRGARPGPRRPHDRDPSARPGGGRGARRRARPAADRRGRGRRLDRFSRAAAGRRGSGLLAERGRGHARRPAASAGRVRRRAADRRRSSSTWNRAPTAATGPRS